MKKILFTITAIFIGVFGLLAPVSVSALTDEECKAQGGVPTAILGQNQCVKDDGQGSSIKEILNMVLDIMTVGIGIIGAIGITVVGIQYMTAGDNEEQVRKSKRRMLEIVIGFAAYVLIYTLLKWLLPTF